MSDDDTSSGEVQDGLTRPLVRYPGATARIAEWYDDEVLRPIEDFQDPKQEWRRLFSEFLGTFFLVLVAAGGGMMGQAFPNTISRTAAVH
jgi:aquaporin Z